MAILSPLVRNTLSKKIRHGYLNEVTSHFRDFLFRIGLTIYPERIIVFGHPSEDFSGFFVKSLSEQNEKLHISWWEQRDTPYEFILAHVCYGAKVLTQTDWKSTFPRWISYTDTISAYLGSSRGRERWTMLLCNIIETCERSRNFESLRHRMKICYHSAMADLEESYDAASGDVLNLTYFQKSLNSLADSEGR